MLIGKTKRKLSKILKLLYTFVIISRLVLKVSQKTIVFCAKITNVIHFSYLPTPPIGQDMTQGQFFKLSLTGLNSEFSF